MKNLAKDYQDYFEDEFEIDNFEKFNKNKPVWK